MQGKVLTVASGKGGVGKTTTAVNLAVALWREGNAVALVDADLGMANLAAVLALEPEATLHDVLSGEAAPNEAIIEAKGGDLLVLPGERDLAGFANADPAKLRSVLDHLAGRCDYVIVDTGAGLSHEDVLPLGLADEVLLVTTPDPAAVGDTRKTLQLSGLLDGPVRGVVVTRALDDADADAIAEELGVELVGTIPEDSAVTESTTYGDPLESHAPDAPATLAYRDLAETIVNAASLADEALESDRGVEASGEEVASDERVASGEDGDPDGEPTAEDGESPTEDAEAMDAAVTSEGAPRESDETGDDSAEAGSEPDEDEATADEDERPEVDDESPDAGEEPLEGDDESAEIEEGDSETDGSAAVEGDGTEAAASENAEPTGGDDAEATAETAEPERKRGGFFGWVGRLFS